jgi:hypothetical protein
MEQDDRPRGPQGTAGVIDESVARRIKECIRQDCISQALKAVESGGMMMGTPEVAEKLQQMCPTPADGFSYDFSEELKAEFPADECLGAAVCYSQTNGNLTYECKKEHRKYLKAALKSGKMKASDRSGIRNEHIIVALQHDKRILPLLMREMENDNVCKALRKFFADVRYVTPNKVNKQDPTAAPTDFRPVGIGCNWYRIANKPLANEAAAHYAPMLADNGQYGLISDGITHAGILPGILLEKDEYKDAAFGIADVRTAFQKISRRAVWDVLCNLPDTVYKQRLKRKFLSIYADKAFGYYTLADGTMKIITISEGVIQGCNFGTLFFNLGYTLKVLKPVKDEFEAKGLKAAPICIHDDSAAIGEPAAVCEMLTRIMQLGRDELALEYGDEKKLIYQSYRTADDQASVAADVENFLPLHEGTVSLVGKVTRTCVRFAGAYIGTLKFVQEALKKAVAGPNSKLRQRMVPFARSSLVSTQHKLAILHRAAGGRTLVGHLARAQSAEQVAEAFELGDELFRRMYETLLHQPEGTFDLGRAGKHMEQAQWPRMLGGDNFIGLPNLMRPASAGAMVGITHLLPKCNLLAAEDKDPQLWHLSNSKRLREASSTIREYLESPYLKYLNVERTGRMYGTIVDKSDDDEDGTEPRGNYQRIRECRDCQPQMFFTTLQCIEDKASVMDDPTVPEKVKHRMQIASQYCAGVASCTVPTDAKLDLTNNEAVFAVCIRLGLPLPGLTSTTRCLRNCALMGPRAELDEATVSESILTGRHFLGCAACGTYCRHNGVVQVLHDFFRLEMCFSGRTRNVGSNYVGKQGTSDRYTDGQVWGSPHTGAKIAFDVGIVEPNSNSHSARSGCNQSFLNVNAGTRDEEREKVKRYKVLCNQRGLTFVPIIFTTCGGMGEAFQRQIWHPHWKRVEAEDAEMKISEWVSRKRKLMWMAKFGAEIAKHNALMISRSQNIADCE